MTSNWYNPNQNPKQISSSHTKGNTAAKLASIKNNTEKHNRGTTLERSAMHNLGYLNVFQGADLDLVLLACIGGIQIKL